MRAHLGRNLGTEITKVYCLLIGVHRMMNTVIKWGGGGEERRGSRRMESVGCVRNYWS